MSFSRDALRIDARQETERIVAFLRESVRKQMRRHGVVVGISGGVDSAVVLALAVRAFGPDKVTAIMMPEKESDEASEQLAAAAARQYGVRPVLENITAALEAFGCYARRDAAMARVFPEYDALAGYRAKLALPPNLLEDGTLNLFSLVVQCPDGTELVLSVPPAEFAAIVAASSYKQRARMAVLYYHAELHHYAVAGTANKNEHDQGFFVKHGDGAVDIHPIVHLFKTQVYQLAEFLDVAEEIRRRPPTTDTYSARGTQQEFFFRLPFETMDPIWYALEHGVPAEEVAQAMDLPQAQVDRVFLDLARKSRTTVYLRMAPPRLSEAPGSAAMGGGR